MFMSRYGARLTKRTHGRGRGLAEALTSEYAADARARHERAKGDHDRRHQPQVHGRLLDGSKQEADAAASPPHRQAIPDGEQHRLTVLVLVVRGQLAHNWRRDPPHTEGTHHA